LRRNAPATLIAVATLLGLTLAGLASTQPSHASSVVVDIKDLAYSPQTIQVTQGDTVTWTNSEEIMPHDVTSGSLGQADVGQRFASEMLMPGQSFSVTFSEAGELVYLCKLHPTMTGVVIVQPSQ
jgi:plastocyanin